MRGQKSLHPPRRSLWAVVALLLVSGVATDAVATNVLPLHPPSGGEKKKWSLDLDLRMQGAVVLLGALDAETGRFGGLEAHANFSARGFGLAAALGYEQHRAAAAPADRELQGGYLLIATQIRPLAPLDRDVYQWFDPFIAIAARLGGVGDDHDTHFRAGLVTSVGFDVRLAPTEAHPVLGFHYRWEPLRHPDRGAEHLLLIGLGVRFAES